jgi:hypothetical protein
MGGREKTAAAWKMGQESEAEEMESDRSCAADMRENCERAATRATPLLKMVGMRRKGYCEYPGHFECRYPKICITNKSDLAIKYQLNRYHKQHDRTAEVPG